MHLKKLLLLLATLALSACATTQQNTAQAPRKPSMVVDIPMAFVPIGCARHPGTSYIYAFYVKEPFSERMAGGLSCGGIGAFGYMLPTQWQPGMKVKVRWNRPIKGEDNWIEKTTTIKRYEKAGTLYVHFFANDEVRVVSAPIHGPGNPDHPIPEDVTVAPPEEE